MFKVSILDIKEASLIFQDNVSSVILPGEDGEMTVLDFHQPFIATLKKGKLKVDGMNLRIKSGVAGMRDEELSILVDKA